MDNSENDSGHSISSKDLFLIIADAKANYVKQKNNVFISNKKVDPTDLPNIAVIDAMISYLNRNGLLKKLVKFDYSE